MKSYLKIAGVCLVTMAIVNRVSAIKSIVNG